MADTWEPLTWPQVVGKRVRTQRLAIGWTPARLAQAIEDTEACVNAIEQGQRDLSVDMLVEVAFALGISPTLLTDGLLPVPRGRAPA